MRASLLFLFVVSFFILMFFGVEQAQLQNLFARFSNASAREQLQILEDVVKKTDIEHGWQLLAKNNIPAVGNLPYFLGNKLFQLYGMDGASRCPQRFSVGCRAGFLQSALEQEGIQNISTFEEMCRSWGDISFCTHGFGHGFVHITDFNVPSALSYCDLYAPDGRENKRRCWQGVFQEDEKRFALLFGADFSPDALTRCATVSEKYQSTCAYSRTIKQVETFRSPFARVAELCTSTDNTYLRRGCILIAGRQIAISKKTTEQTKKTCNEFFPDDAESAYCIMGAAEFAALSPDTATKSTALALCKIVPASFHNQCVGVVSNPTSLGKSLEFFENFID